VTEGMTRDELHAAVARAMSGVRDHFGAKVPEDVIETLRYYLGNVAHLDRAAVHALTICAAHGYVAWRAPKT